MANAHSNYLPPITETSEKMPTVISRTTSDSPLKNKIEKRSQSKVEGRQKKDFRMPGNKKDDEQLKSVEVKPKLKAILPKAPGFAKKEERSEVQSKASAS